MASSGRGGSKSESSTTRKHGLKRVIIERIRKRRRKRTGRTTEMRGEVLLRNHHFLLGAMIRRDNLKNEERTTAMAVPLPV